MSLPKDDVATHEIQRYLPVEFFCLFDRLNLCLDVEIVSQVGQTLEGDAQEEDDDEAARILAIRR